MFFFESVIADQVAATRSTVSTLALEAGEIMRLLWVEDFGGCDCEPLLLDIFGLPPERSRALARYQDNIDSKEQDYEKWRRWYLEQPWEKAPEIDICTSEVEFDALTSHMAVCRYDAVLLDVNLTENEFFLSSSHCDSEKGGFWLYNKLIRSGFPSGRIALLTAHTGETDIENFIIDCERFGHEKLVGLPKSGKEAKEWIRHLSHENGSYPMLRRGVLDAIDFCKALLEKHGVDAIRFNRYVSDTNRWTYDDACNFLCSLSHLLPVRTIGSESHLQLRGFLYVLAREWDTANPEDGHDRYYQALGRAMKLVRNMASHDSLLDDASTCDMAFYTFASIRTAFLIPGSSWEKPQHYELRLISLMGSKEPLHLEILASLLAKQASEARLLLRARVSNKILSTTRKDKRGNADYVRDQTQYHKIVSELVTSANRPKLDFLEAVKKSFMHGVFVPEGTPADYDESKFNMLDASYQSGIKKVSHDMPFWVRAVFERIQAAPK